MTSDSSIDLGNYIMSYEVTSLPRIIYAHLYRADHLPSSEDFDMPPLLDSLVVEIRIGLFDKEGCLIQMSSQLVTASKGHIIKALTVIPNKMIDSLVQRNE